MHAKPSDCICSSIANEVEWLVMIALLSSGHSTFSRAELEREVSGSKDKPIDINDAIERLHAMGLLNLAGELVIPSRAAKYMDEMLGRPL
jgi:hypothetical protein